MRKSSVEKLLSKTAFGSQGCVWPKEGKYDDCSNAYVIFTNSQPSAVDGLKDIL